MRLVKIWLAALLLVAFVDGQGAFAKIGQESELAKENNDLTEELNVEKTEVENEKKENHEKFEEGEEHEREEEEEEKEEEEEEENIFHNGDALPGVYVLQNLIILIVITVLFEKVTYWIKHKLKPYPHYSEMLAHVFQELTILGFISFTITIFIQGGLLPEGGERMVAFEYAHVAIFFVAMIYTIQAAVIAGVTVPVKRMWRACDEQDKEEFDMDLQCHKAKRHKDKQVKYSLWLVRQYHQLRCTFLKLNPDLPSNFKFALYLENSLNLEAVEMMEISDGSYVFAVVTFGLMCLLLEYGGTCCTLKYTLVIGYIILVLNLTMLALSQVLIFKLLQSGPCPCEHDDSGVPTNHREWWVNKYDYDVEDVNLLAELAEEGEKGGEHGHNGEEGKHEHHEEGNEHEHAKKHKTDEESSENLIEQKEHEINLGCIKINFHPNVFKKLLDIMQLFNCYYMGWFLSHAMIYSADEKMWGYFFFIPIPSLIMQFFGGPLMFMNYSILLAVSESRDPEVFEETVAYMEKESEVVQLARARLKNVSIDELFRLGEEPELETGMFANCSPRKFIGQASSQGDGKLDYREFKQAMGKVGLKFTYLDFIKLVRVVDPDQSGEIEREELEEFIGSGSLIAKKARTRLVTLDLEQVFTEYDQDNSGTLDRHELKHALAAHGAHFNYDDFKSFFKRIDDDQSGEVSYQELQDWVHGGEEVPPAGSIPPQGTTNLFRTPAANTGNIQSI